MKRVAVLADATFIRVGWLGLSLCLVGTVALLVWSGGCISGAYPGGLAGGGVGTLKDAQMVLDAGQKVHKTRVSLLEMSEKGALFVDVGTRVIQTVLDNVVDEVLSVEILDLVESGCGGADLVKGRV